MLQVDARQNAGACGDTLPRRHDHAGNLIVDQNYQYIYDAWNRLVGVRSDADTDIAVQTAEFYGNGRRGSERDQ